MVLTINSKTEYNTNNTSQCWRGSGASKYQRIGINFLIPHDYMIAATTPPIIMRTLDCDGNNVLCYIFSKCSRSSEDHLTKGEGPDRPTLHEIVDKSLNVYKLLPGRLPIIVQWLPYHHQVRRNWPFCQTYFWILVQHLCFYVMYMCICLHVYMYYSITKLNLPLYLSQLG